MIIKFIIFGFVEILLETIAWGTFGYLFFRFIGWKEERWKLDFVIVLALFLMWSYYAGAVMSELDITIGNREILDFIGGDAEVLSELDYLDLIMGIVQIYLGYMFGKWIHKRLKSRVEST